MCSPRGVSKDVSRLYCPDVGVVKRYHDYRVVLLQNPSVHDVLYIDILTVCHGLLFIQKGLGVRLRININGC